MLSFATSTCTARLGHSYRSSSFLSPHVCRPLFTSFRLRRLRRPRLSLVMTVDTPAPLDEEVDPGVVQGTSLRIVHYPHPALRAPNEPVQQFDADLKKLSREMFKVMYASRGVGLAAPQVGVNKRLMVFNPDSDEKAFLKEVVLVNPEIVATSKKTLVEPEACLSFPGISGDVRRHEWIKVEAQRLNGKKFKVKYSGWVGRIFQHEYDHLEGVVYVDRVEEESKAQVNEGLKKLIAEYSSKYENAPEKAL